MTSLVISNLKVWWLSAVTCNLHVITLRIYLAQLGSRVCSLATDNGRLCGESQRLHQEKERLEIQVSLLSVCLSVCLSDWLTGCCCCCCCCCSYYSLCCCYNFMCALSLVSNSWSFPLVLLVLSLLWIVLLGKALAGESDLICLNYSLFRLSLQDKCWSRIPFPSKRRGMYPLHGLIQYRMKVLLSSFHWNGHTLGFHPQT